ncbi:hypothetical protein CPB84DRAFT_1792152 [Gymnopilus junonius]|uniref:F-box domain-containing protein n=1 Tax=Gymnopilus junonius TaxID=109634 RepID=A0A9P5NCX0_GYMJU|nr:hypothetical protein CPB84DRAFT_1792152 [Gymnopilus junonius]
MPTDSVDSPANNPVHVELPYDADCCNICTKLIDLDEKISRAKAIVQDLLRQRESFRSKFNQAHPSLLDRFPVEVASTIFEFYVSSADGKESPFTLGAVCRRWRSIVWSTPNIWTTLSISRSGTRRVLLSETRVQLMKDYLGRSGKRPLSITLHVSPLKQELPQFHTLMKAINQHCDHWYSLDLKFSRAFLSSLTDSGCTSSPLQKLSISLPMRSNVMIDTLTRIAPRIVVMRASFLNIVGMNWTNVTHLTVSCLPTDKAFQIFRMSPCLQKCTFGSVMFRNANSPTEACSPVTHTVLESLEIKFQHEQAEESFFNNLTLSNLKHLDVRGKDIELRAEHLVPFLARSSNELKSLSIDEDDYAGEGLIHIVRVTPSLERLCIARGNADEDHMDLFFDALASHLPNDSSGLSSPVDPLLPLLQTFEWTGDGTFPWDVIRGRFLIPLSPTDNNLRRPLEMIKVCFVEDEEDDTVPYIDEHTMLQLMPFIDQIKFSFTIGVNGGWDDVWKLSVDRITREKTNKGILISS